ncbi:MAG: tetratricopeptide repeat protein [Chlorobi bacterium]|nr:tetratricopeptide repeat protein [Chlorobiota bacterium]
MAKKGKEVQTEHRMENFEEALTKTEQFIEDNQKILTIIVGIIVIIVIGFTVYRRYVVAPKQKEAMSQMYVAEQYFERDSFNLALNGDGNNLGFLDIIDTYGITKSANLAKYYTGICFLHLGKYEDAIDYLSKFKSKDKMLSVIAKGALGDAFMQTGDTQKALDHYLQAGNASDNAFLAPIYLMKAGEVLESLDEYNRALTIYREIQEKYPKSQEGRNIDKYISRVELLSGESK